MRKERSSLEVPWQEVVQGLAEFVEPGAVNDPAGRQKGPFGQTLTVARPVLEVDGVRRRIEADRMLGRHIAGTPAGDRYLSLAVMQRHPTLNLERGTRRAVLLPSMMPVVDEGIVAVQGREDFRRLIDQAIEDVDAQRKVRRLHDTDAGAFDQLTDLAESALPAGGPNHQRERQLRRRAHRVDHGFGNGEIDERTDLFERTPRRRIGREGPGAGEPLDDNHSLSRGEVVDDAPHLSIADQGELHRFSSRPASSRASRTRASSISSWGAPPRNTVRLRLPKSPANGPPTSRPNESTSSAVRRTTTSRARAAPRATARA